jgi:hypothetical protein
MSPARVVSALNSEQVCAAWAAAFAPPSEGHERQLGILLDGLPLIAAGRVQDEARQALTLDRVTERAAEHEPAAHWEAEVRHGAERRPFLAELARRVLVLGHLREPYPEEDRLLCPRRTRIDPACADAPLALARAVTAVELQQAGLLAEVTSRHLLWQAQAGERGSVLPLLGVLPRDETAQCLLVTALATGQPGTDGHEAKELFRLLVAHYETCRERAEGPPPEWPAGPLSACCALGLLFRRPRAATLLAEFRGHVEGWPGWQDESWWPTRPAATGLADLKARLTDRAAAALGLGQRKPWPRAALAAQVETCWPPLLAFCSPAALPPARGERDEPHP